MGLFFVDELIWHWLDAIVFFKETFVFSALHAKFASFTVKFLFDGVPESCEEITTFENTWTEDVWIEILFLFLFYHSCKFKDFS